MRSPYEAFDRRNLLTYVSLGCGIAAVGAASAGSASWAAAAIALAAIADTFDGRFARRFSSDEARRALGAELDSLADSMAFGAAPMVCTLFLIRPSSAIALALLMAAAAAYLACAITRLAFFNVQLHEPQTGFVGIPVPVAALIWASALLAHPSAITTALVIAGTAAAMVAPLRIARPTGIGLAIFTCWPIAILFESLIAYR
jgi:phosphatidylserine synthase